MKVAIVGAGPGGAFLYHLLSKSLSLEVQLFDHHKRKTACETRPCGWAVPLFEFLDLCEHANLLAPKYIKVIHHQVILNDVKMRAEIAIIDKPLLLNDLTQGQALHSSPLLGSYDRIIDATGISRAYLPPAAQLYKAKAGQVKIKTIYTDLIVKTLKGGGCEWIFPMGNGETHIGSCAPIGSSPQPNEASRSFDLNTAMCRCSGELWYGGPISPFIQGKVWGLGESIGLVSPLIGAGIIPAMDSAKLMVENWDSAIKYENAILAKYSYMMREANLAKAMLNGRSIKLWNWPLLKKTFTASGVYPSWWQMAKLPRQNNN